MPRPRKDIPGKQFNHLTVIKQLPEVGKRRYCLCRCSCGNEINCISDSVIQGNRKSCGCRSHDNKHPPHRRGQDHYKWSGVGEMSGDYWKELKNRAQKKKIDVAISKEEAWTIFEEQKGKCALSGIDISCKSLHKKLKQTASLDRIDSSKGYIPGNVQWVHKMVNFMKRHYPEKMFIDMCKKIAKYHENKN